MKTYVVILFSFLFSSNLIAQKDKEAILKDPDISWAAETFIYCNPDKSRAELRKLDIYGLSQTLKVVNHTPKNSDKHEIQEDYNHFLNYKFLTHPNILDESIKMYEDSELKKVLTREQYKKKHTYEKTVNVYDPETKQVKQEVMEVEVPPNAVVLYKLKVILYYNTKTKMFQALPLAIAPVMYDNKGGEEKEVPLFWLPVRSNDKTDLGENIDYAKRTTITARLDSKTLKVLKKEENGSTHNAVDDLIRTVKTKPESIDAYSVFTAITGDPLTKKEKQMLMSRVEEIITFDPQTGEEIKQTRIVEADTKDISGLRIAQDWSWDYKNGQLIIRYLGFAPIIKRYDDNGNFLNSGPIFWRRVANFKD